MGLVPGVVEGHAPESAAGGLFARRVQSTRRVRSPQPMPRRGAARGRFGPGLRPTGPGWPAAWRSGSAEGSRAPRRVLGLGSVDGDSPGARVGRPRIARPSRPGPVDGLASPTPSASHPPNAEAFTEPGRAGGLRQGLRFRQRRARATCRAPRPWPSPSPRPSPTPSEAPRPSRARGLRRRQAKRRDLR